MCQQQFRGSEVTKQRIGEVFMANEAPLSAQELDYIEIFLYPHSKSIYALNYKKIFEEFGK